MTVFEEFGLVPALLQAVHDLGFETPTPVQARVIPLLLKGRRDLVALAQTGTGKTAAFGLPLLQLTDPANPEPQAVILCPTRELCLQITGHLASFSKHMGGVRALAVYGGAPIATQIRALQRGVQIIVATPGRMHDLLRRKCAKLSGVQRVVLDEADEMLQMGFQEDMEAILNEVPDSAQTLLFSATMSRQVAGIAGKYMHEPEEIVIGQRNSGAENVTHEYYLVHSRDRYPALKRLVDFYRDMYAIVFCRTRIETQDVADRLMADGCSADALHGELSQAQRDRVMQSFRDRKIRLLVATDVAARGLDVDDLTHVINFSLPDAADHYTHRSGRTGRAGKEGLSIALVNQREEGKIRIMERIIRQKFVQKPLPSGRQVCEAQLKGLLAQIQQVNAADARLDAYMPLINEILADMPREEMIKRLVLREFSRFLDGYKNAPDLNANERHERREHSKGRAAIRAGQIRVNIGLRNNLTPADLITLINRATPGPMVRVGRIRIMDQSSEFEISTADAPMLIPALNEARYNDRPVRAVLVEGERAKPGFHEIRKGYARGRPAFHGGPGKHAGRHGAR